MELELKHLAAYFQHAMDVQSALNASIKGMVLEMSVSGDVFIVGVGWAAKHCVKLILKPMSQLTLKELEDEAQFPKSIAFYAFQSAKKNDLSQTPYFVVEYMLSKHYDIFDLISKGLAVEK